MRRIQLEGWLFIALLSCDLIQALGFVLSARWVHLRQVIQDRYCTVQGKSKMTYPSKESDCLSIGVLHEFGNVGVAVFMFAIAMNTLTRLVFEAEKPKSSCSRLWLCLLLTSPLFNVLVLVTAIPPAVNGPNYYAPTG